MASTHERDIKRKLKEHGWQFLRRGKGGHDIYTHDRRGNLAVTYDKNFRALQELFKDIEQGPRAGKNKPRPGLIEEKRRETFGEDTSSEEIEEKSELPPIYAPQPASDLAELLDLSPQGVQWRYNHETIKDGIRIERCPSPPEVQAGRNGVQHYYFAVAVPEELEDGPVDASDRDEETDTMEAAEQLLEEASQRVVSLTQENTELRAQVHALQDARGDLRQQRAQLKEQLAGVTEELDEAQEQLAIQHQELEARVARTPSSDALRKRIADLETQIEALEAARQSPLYIESAVKQLAVAPSDEIMERVAELRRLLLLEHFSSVS